MGATIRAYAGIGIIIDSRNFNTITVPSCQHDERTGHKFCPVCGVKVADLVEIDEKPFDGFREYIDWGSNKETMPPDFVFTEIDPFSHDKKYFFGWGGSAGEYDGPYFREISKMDAVHEILSTIQAMMETWNVPYNSDTFGFHVIQYYA